MRAGKIVVIGAGSVGTTYAYSLLNQSIASELVLVDIDEKRVEAEVMDLNHGIYYTNAPIKIKKGSYTDCYDADIVCITAGLSQNKDATRLDFAEANTNIFKSIIFEVLNSGFDGIFVIASNPVDVMTLVTKKLSGFPSHKVIGSGTILDTSRYCQLIGWYLNISPQEVNGYIIGEHGDSQVASISTTTIGGKPLMKLIEQEDPHNEFVTYLKKNVRDAASQVLQGKNATHYGIGIGLARLTKAILSDENAILPVSSYVQGEYGYKDIYFGTPAVINRQGVSKIIELELNDTEKKELDASIKVIQESINSLKI